MKERIEQAMHAAMKAGNKERTSALRMLMADIQYAELAGKQIEEAVVGYARKLERSIREYADLGKHEEAEKLRREHEIVSEFAPRRFSEMETEAAIMSIIDEMQLAGPQDYGKAMKRIMSDYGSQVDGSVVQAILKRKLNEKAGK